MSLSLSLRPEPKTITSGDTVSWVVADRVAAFPASAGWVLTYFFSQAAEVPAQVVATADGDTFAISWACSLAPGVYRWASQVALGTVKQTLAQSTIRVNPDPSVSYDRRTQAEINLAVVNAALAGRVGDPLLKYKIDGIEAEKIQPKDLLALRDRFLSEIRIERGGSAVRRIPANRFVGNGRFR